MTEVRDRIFKNPTRKLVAMRLADCANDEGHNVYPKVWTIAADCLIKERAVQQILREFEAEGLLEVVQEARGHRQRTYTLNVEKLCELPLTAAAVERRRRKQRKSAAKNAGEGTAANAVHEPSAPRSRGAPPCTPSSTRGASPCTPRGAPPCTPIRTVSKNRQSPKGEPLGEPARESGPADQPAGFELTPPSPPPKPRASRLSPDWQPTATDVAFARDAGLTDEEISREGDKFRDYWISKSGKDATKRDWSATWRNWIRNCDRYGGRSLAGQGSGGNRREPASSAEAFARGCGVDPNQVDRS